jgi:hypothetical protein
MTEQRGHDCENRLIENETPTSRRLRWLAEFGGDSTGLGWRGGTPEKLNIVRKL